MRTTITLEPDVSKKLKERIEVEGMTMKAAINEALRVGLKSKPARPKPFKVVPFSTGGLLPGLSYGNMNHLAEDLETEEIVRKLKQGPR